MEDNKIERFKKRQSLKQEIKGKGNLSIVKTDNTTDTLVKNHLNTLVDTETVIQHKTTLNEKYNFSLTDTNISSSEVNQLIKSLQSEYDKEKMNLLVSDCKNTVIDSIIKPFGIGKYVIAKLDKDGGNVTTLHNAENQVFANDKDQERYNRSYNKNSYHYGNPLYNKKSDERKSLSDDGKQIDDYTGENISGTVFSVSEKGRTQRNYHSSTEHYVAAKEIHDNPETRLFMDEKESSNLANSDVNLGVTTRSINSSKQETPLNKWMNSPSSADKNINNSEAYKIDKDAALKKDEKARNHINKELNNSQIKKQGVETAVSSSREGMKMGLQQAVGLVLKELTESIFDEVSDIYKNGFRGGNKMDKTFFAVLKERLMRIGSNILNKWKDVVKAFGEGFFSGLLSNLVTVVVNMFITTGKRVVRMIREGVFSLLKAVKMLLFPPKDMTLSEAAHEATKLLAAGLAVSGGIILEQYLETLLEAIPFADMISTVISGIVTGLGTALLVYLIGKMDIFGVEKERKNEFIIDKLINIGDSCMDETESLLEELAVNKIY